MTVGRKGYIEKTRGLATATKTLRAGIEKIPGIVMMGPSDVSVVAFTSEQFNIYDMSEASCVFVQRVSR